MSPGKGAALVIHEWTVFAHPMFLAQIEGLGQQVESFEQKDPVGYVKKNASKRQAAITKLAFEVIPQVPTRPEYHQAVPLATITSTGSASSSFSNTDCSSATTCQAK